MKNTQEFEILFSNLNSAIVKAESEHDIGAVIKLQSLKPFKGGKFKVVACEEMAEGEKNFAVNLVRA